MEDNKSVDDKDTENQKKVKFDEKENKSPRNTKDHDDHDEEEDAQTEIIRNPDEKVDTDNVNGKDENDGKDGLGNDLEIIETAYKTESNEDGETSKTLETNKNDQTEPGENGTETKQNETATERNHERTERLSYPNVNNQTSYSLSSRRTDDSAVNKTDELKLADNSDNETSSEMYKTDDDKLKEIQSPVTDNKSDHEGTGNTRQLNWEETERDQNQPRDDTSSVSSRSSKSSKSSSSDSGSEKSFKDKSSKDKREKEVVTGNPLEKNNKSVYQNTSQQKSKSFSKTAQPIKVKESAPQETNKPPQHKYNAPRTPLGSYKPTGPRWNVKDTVKPTPEVLAQKRLERRQKSHSARYASHGNMTRRTSSRSSTIRSSETPSRPRTTLGFSERRRKEREFFHAELQRLKDSLRKESKKIKKPKVRDHYPDVFTSLAPYYDTYTANYLIKMPELGYKETQPPEAKKPDQTSPETKDLMYTTRCTSIGLCDPEDSLRMDRSVLPKLETAEIRRRRIEQMHAMENKPKSGRASSNTDRDSPKDMTGQNTEKNSEAPQREKRPEAKQGSTRLPKFPVIAPPNAELTTKELRWSDVPMLREEMIKSFSHFGEDRKKSDYTRTRQDFFRMELDRFDEYHDTTKPHMRAAYFAYLQNTPGSRKAIYDCMKEITSPKKKPEQSPQAVA